MLRIVQKASLKQDWHTVYVDTAGFAIRREYLKQPGYLFDVGLIRGEDTLLMTSLLRQGRQPRFVPDATIYHNHGAPLHLHLLKHVSIGYRSARADKLARDLVAKEWKGSKLRRNTLRELADNARRQRYGYGALTLILIAYCLKLTGRIAYSLFGLKPGRHQVLNAPVDAVTSAELVARLVQAGERRTSLTATYVNGWSLVNAERDSIFCKSLAEFELCFADGIGVVYTLLLLKGMCLRKVTANDFCALLFQEAANRRLRVALVGAKEGVAQAVASKMRRDIPDLQVLLCSSGYLNTTEEENLVNALREVDAHIVLVGRGQPVQELWVQRCRKLLPNTVFLCVGGLFDYVTGQVRSTPIWVRRIGFEWLHRLVHHPRRYGYMYIYGIPLLLWYVSKHKLARMIRWASS